MTEYTLNFWERVRLRESSEFALLSHFHIASKLFEETKVFSMTSKLKLLIPHVAFFIDKGIPDQIFCDFQSLF